MSKVKTTKSDRVQTSATVKNGYENIYLPIKKQLASDFISACRLFIAIGLNLTRIKDEQLFKYCSIDSMDAWMRSDECPIPYDTAKHYLSNYGAYKKAISAGVPESDAMKFSADMLKLINKMDDPIATIKQARTHHKERIASAKLSGKPCKGSSANFNAKDIKAVMDKEPLPNLDNALIKQLEDVFGRIVERGQDLHDDTLDNIASLCQQFIDNKEDLKG